MKAFTLLKMCQDMITLAHKYGLSIHDVKYIPMYREYRTMRGKEHQKYEYTMEILSEKYKLSTSQIKRLVKKYETTIEDLI